MLRRNPSWLHAALLAAAGLCGLPCAAQTAGEPPRGRLLYDTHCAECHNLQVHWRDGRLVTDWASLKAQVRRWQGRALLGWSEADINEVARYLNASVYRYAQTDGVVGMGAAEPR